MTDHLDPSDTAVPPTPDQWDAVARFLAGESAAGEAADLRQWLSEHPGDAQAVVTIDSLLPPSAGDAQLANTRRAGTLPFGRPIDVEGALRSVHAQMETTGSAPALTERDAARAVRPTHRSAVPARRTWVGPAWAAAAVVVAATGVTQWRNGHNRLPATAQSFSASVGVSDSVLLSDGSRVILAPGSKLTVAANYSKAQRSVELQGDGQFTVRHDARHPFTVRSGAAIINDLGTVFTVKAVVGKGVVVSVTEGSVSLSDSSAAGQAKAVILTAGDRGRLRTDGTLLSERGSVTPDESAWVVGKLVYVDASLAEVQADLRRWYGVELVVEDSSWRAQSITTQGLASEPAEKLVAKLAIMYGGGVTTKRGDTLFVDRSGDRPKH